MIFICLDFPERAKLRKSRNLYSSYLYRGQSRRHPGKLVQSTATVIIGHTVTHHVVSVRTRTEVTTAVMCHGSLDACCRRLTVLQWVTSDRIRAPAGAADALDTVRQQTHQHNCSLFCRQYMTNGRERTENYAMVSNCNKIEINLKIRGRAQRESARPPP